MLGRAVGSLTGPFIHPREGRGDGSRKPSPASHWELPDLLAAAAGKDFSSMNTQM